jgi:ABC-type antimicrobial peptide transport system permease subunit
MPIRDRFERPLVMLLVVVGSVLLIACANIANLALARTIAQRTQRAVRIALGASQWQLARHSLLESFLLSAVGAAGGIAFGRWASEALISQLSTQTMPVAIRVAFDWRVLAFTGALLVLTTVVSGVIPAVRATSVDPIEALREQGRFAGNTKNGRLLGLCS